MDAAALQTRGLATGLLGARTIGALTIGLSATPTGTVNTAVLDFTGGTTVQRGTAQVPTPIVVVHSDANGSTFKIALRGRWVIRARIPVATAAQVRASISVDSAAADGAGEKLAGTNPALSVAQPDVQRWVGAAAGEAGTIPLTATIDVTSDMANNPAQAIVRLFANNGAAGVAPAATLAPLADGFIYFERIGDVDN